MPAFPVLREDQLYPGRCLTLEMLLCGVAEGSFTGCLKDLGDLPHDVFLSIRSYSNETKAGRKKGTN